MATTTGELPISTDNMTVDVCSTETAPTPFQVFYAVVFSTLIFCNTVLVVAAVMSWRVLRQNIVHRYLVSCLVSVICFCIVSMYELFHTLSHYEERHVKGGLLQRYNSSDESHHSLMHRDAYLKGVLPALLIVMEFNIAALIYAVSDNAFFIGRYANRKLSSGSRGKADSPNKKIVHRRRMVRWKKYKATFLIPIAWMVPTIISIPTGFNWNCVDYCLCLPVYRDNASTCVAPDGSSTICSRVWLPLTHSYITVITVLYFTAMIVMFVMLISTVRSFYKTRTQQRPPDALLTTSASAKGKNNSKTQSTISTFCKRKRPPLDDTVKLLIVTTLSLFVSVTPMLLICFIDPFVETAPTATHFSITMAFTLVYAACLPFILLKYMSGLRKACVNIVMKCPCLRTDILVVTSNQSRKSARSKTTTSSERGRVNGEEQISVKNGSSSAGNDEEPISVNNEPSTGSKSEDTSQRVNETRNGQ